jgi:large subunit ribosomal protein L16
MALSPSRTKFRRAQKGSNAGKAKRGNTIAFGEFGIQAMSRVRLDGRQLEAARVAMPVTKKPAETRMGRGKGPVEFYVALIKPGAILFELAGVPVTIAREAMRLADTKLPCKCRFIAREGVEA